MWHLVDPDTGNNNAVVTYSGSLNYVAAGCSVYTGVDQTDPIGATDGCDGASGTTIGASDCNAPATSVDDLVIDSVIGDSTDISASQSARWEVTSTVMTAGSSDEPGTGGNVTMEWTQNQSDVWATVGAVMQPSVEITTRKVILE